MGDISELIQEGVLCQVCGSLMEDLIQPGTDQLKQGPGHPRTCNDCKKPKHSKPKHNPLNPQNKNRRP